jgi:hypothetical protein
LHRTLLFTSISLALVAAAPVKAGIIFSSGLPNGSIGMASHPGPTTGANQEVEAADDFVITFNGTNITEIKFFGLLFGGGTIADVNDASAEIYRVFPLDSTNPPDGRVPTRVNSPSDVAFEERNLGDFTMILSSLGPLTVLNSVVHGINPIPGQTTLGEGPVTGTEILVDLVLNTPITLPAGHYFFVPQIGLNTGTFLWLSGDRPLIGPSDTPINPDLQAWIRNATLDPDWLRVGTDIIGGATPPTFNGAFELDGTVPEPSTILLIVGGLGMLAVSRRRA